MRVTKTWADNLNDAIRDKVFPDEELMRLMLVPAEAKENIRVFLDRFFIKEAISDEIITDEPVRILYHHKESTGIVNNPYAHKRYLTFEIYVKKDRLFDCDPDRMRARTEMIVQRLKEIFTDKTYVCRMRYLYEDDYEIGTRLTGYTRHVLIFSYKTTN